MSLTSDTPVAVFPLPDVVLFPTGILPLHIFELRYRTMVRDALSASRHLVMALLQPGWERDYKGAPPLHALGCLARIEEVEWLPNDCYDLVLLGIARVRLGRASREYPYRLVTPTVLDQHPYPNDDPLVELEKRALLDSWLRLARERAPDDRAPTEPDGALPLETLVNRFAMVLPVPALEKLRLLEMDSVIERSQRVRELTGWLLRRPKHSRPEGESDHN